MSLSVVVRIGPEVEVAILRTDEGKTFDAELLKKILGWDDLPELAVARIDTKKLICALADYIRENEGEPS